MAAAAAEDGVQGVLNFLIGRMRVLVEEYLGVYENSIHAVAALRSLFLDEGLLQFARVLFITQTFECCDFLPHNSANRSDAGANSLSINDDCAGAALRQTTAIFGTIEFQIITQSVEQGHVISYIELMRTAIYLECGHRGLGAFPYQLASRAARP